MKRMLFNATHSEELRIAVVDGQTLVNLDIDYVDSKNKKGNIYRGKITKIEPSLEAAFVDFGASRHGFLSVKDISRKYFSKQSESTPLSDIRIQDVVSVGDSLIVQVEKEERGNKGAALTSFISLAGRYLVLLPNNSRGGGISRQIEGKNRHELKEIMSQLEIPTEHSVIARTAGIGQSVENFQTDLKYLLNLWRAIENAAEQNSDPFLIYQESSLIIRTLRDYLRDEIGQILIDNKELYERTLQFVQDVMPNSGVTVRYYNDSVPLFSRFQIEHQIKDVFERKVDLPNGGAIVIDQTEALVTIDVNSARATKGADIEETALKTNLEAVEQIAKQLRIRDIGGLIVIDLIDMSSQHDKRSVENQFAEALRSDRARVRVGRISKFGLLEMSRQRLRSSIEESSHDVCPRCQGRGFIRNVTSSGLSILRILEEDALKENTELIHAHLPIEIATFLLNDKRHELNKIEQRFATRIIIVPNNTLKTPDHRILRFKASEVEKNSGVLSYNLQYPNQVNEVFNFVGGGAGNSGAQPAVSHEEMKSASEEAKRTGDSFLGKMVSAVFGSGKPKAAPEIVVEEKKSTPTRRKPARRNTRQVTSDKQGRPNSRRGASHGRPMGQDDRPRRRPNPKTRTSRGANGIPKKETDSRRGPPRRRNVRKQPESQKNVSTPPPSP